MGAGGGSNAGGEVGEPHRGIRGVLMLAPGPARPERLHPTLAQEVVVRKILRERRFGMGRGQGPVSGLGTRGQPTWGKL